MKLPIRQNLPNVLKFALILWASTALIFYNQQYICQAEWFQTQIFWIIIFNALLIIFFIICAIKSTKFHFIHISIVAILLGILLATICSLNILNNSNKILTQESNSYTFNIIEDQKQYDSFSSCVATESSSHIKVKLNINNSDTELHAGDTIKAKTKFYGSNENQKNNYWQNAICANAKIENFEIVELMSPLYMIYKFRNNLIDTIRQYDNNVKSDSEQLLSAIVCGQRIDLNSSGLYDSFKSCGLAHLVAVSGAHLSLVTTLLLLVLKKLKLKKHIIIAIQSIFIFMYLICAAIPISALRAAIMAYVALFAFFSKRRPAPLNALGICIIILLALHPETSLSVSFALSASSTIGIILFSRLIEYRIYSLVSKCPKTVSESVSLTIASWVCSLPLSISIFEQFSIISPIANIICSPIFTVLCALGLVSSIFATCLSWFLPHLSAIAMNCSFFVSYIMTVIVKQLASLPYSSIPASINLYVAIFISLIISFLLYITWPKNNKRSSKIKYGLIVPAMAIAVVFWIIFIPKNLDTQLSMLDIGQGDSILLQSSGKNFLIDTGNQDTKLKDNLAKKNISHLDGLLITHPDDDHCGSLDVIEQLVEVSNVYVAKDLPNTNNSNCTKLMLNIRKLTDENNIIKLSVGDKINFGEYCLEIIWPDKYHDEGGNQDSLCVLANVDLHNDGSIEDKILLCGDAEQNEIDSMIKLGRLGKIDIYKCGHHGSKNAINEQSCKILSPKISLISVGKNNRYGHPNRKTIEKLENCNSNILRSDEKGTVTCTFKDNEINIITEK